MLIMVIKTSFLQSRWYIPLTDPGLGYSLSLIMIPVSHVDMVRGVFMFPVAHVVSGWRGGHHHGAGHRSVVEQPQPRHAFQQQHGLQQDRWDSPAGAGRA